MLKFVDKIFTDQIKNLLGEDYESDKIISQLESIKSLKNEILSLRKLGKTYKEMPFTAKQLEHLGPGNGFSKTGSTWNKTQKSGKNKN